MKVIGIYRVIDLNPTYEGANMSKELQVNQN